MGLEQGHADDGECFLHLGKRLAVGLENIFRRKVKSASFPGRLR